jgi:Tol biopolymer transport system component
MSKVDDELSRRFRRAERPIDDAAVFEGVARRRRRRRTLQRLEAGALAVVVIAGTAGGFLALRSAFREDGHRNVGSTPLPGNGLIVFERFDADADQSHLFTMRPDGTDVQQLTDFTTSDHEPAVSPDGRTVAFIHEFEDRSPALATIPIDGATPATIRLTDEHLFVTSGPSWSPDGAQLTFAARDDVGQRVFVSNADGTELRALTPRDLYWVHGAAWSPDGSRIAFTASTISGDVQPSRWDVYTIRPDGTELTRLTETPTPEEDESNPTWDPRGERLAFARSDTFGSSWLVLLDLADGRESLITDGSTEDTAPSWSPDGSLLAFERRPGGQELSQVWTVRPDGAGLVQVTHGGGVNASWQPIASGSTIVPEPSASPSPQTGRDIGLAFPLCHVERLSVYWYDDGTEGAAWTGARQTPDGGCPEEGTGDYVVAADLDGDGRAEPGGIGFLSSCLFCRPYAATDLDADGVLELVVLQESSATPSFALFEVSVPTSERSPGIYNLSVAPPGHPEAGIRPNEPLRFSTGGDEGFAGWVGCDGRGGDLILQLTWRSHPIEGGVQDVHETDLVLRHGIFVVVASRDYELPRGVPVARATDEAACGVDWQI